MRQPSERRVRKAWKSVATADGAGVKLRRAFGFHQIPQLDPFLLLDAFRSDDPGDYVRGFPWHPHRGMETITYILDGDVEHKDILGNGGVISAGDAQWMTAGSGIVHQEMPKGDRKGRMWGFQLWVNLPAKLKMTDPRYRGIAAREIPEVKTADGARVRVLCGEVAGVRGPVRDVAADPEFLDVSLPAATTFRHATALGRTVFAYVVEGEALFDPERDPYSRELVADGWFETERSCLFGADSLVLYGPGRDVVVTSEARPVRFLLVSGKPIGEPIAWYGPVVMNTQAELKLAFEEFEKGTFVKFGRHQAA